MKSVLYVLVVAIIMTSAACAPSDGTSQDLGPANTDFSVSACPFLKGDYELDNMHMTIFESRNADNYRIILGVGAEELIIDGRTHSFSNAEAQYKGFCANEVLQIEAQGQGGRVIMKYYFSDDGNLVQETTGSENEVRVWKRLSR